MDSPQQVAANERVPIGRRIVMFVLLPVTLYGLGYIPIRHAHYLEVVYEKNGKVMSQPLRYSSYNKSSISDSAMFYLYFPLIAGDELLFDVHVLFGPNNTLHGVMNGWK